MRTALWWFGDIWQKPCLDGLTCTVTTKILTTCSISLQGLRPLARNLSQGLIKKYLRRRRRSSSSGGVVGTGEVPIWVPYPGLGVSSLSVSKRMGKDSRRSRMDNALCFLPQQVPPILQAILQATENAEEKQE